MAYIKQNFVDGNVLNADDLNAMDDQIAANEQAANRIATSENVGQVRAVGGWSGIQVSDDGTLVILGASPSDLAGKSEWSKPIVAANYLNAIKIALAEAISADNPAYSDSEQAIACRRLGAMHKKHRLLHTETADGTTSFIRFTADDDGNPFDVEELVMFATIPATDYNVRFELYLQNGTGAWKTAKASTTGAMQKADSTCYTETHWFNHAGRWQCECVTSVNATVGSFNYRSVGDTTSEVSSIESIKAVLVYIFGTDVKIPSGTTFEFWGR